MDKNADNKNGLFIIGNWSFDVERIYKKLNGILDSNMNISMKKQHMRH